MVYCEHFLQNYGTIEKLAVLFPNLAVLGDQSSGWFWLRSIVFPPIDPGVLVTCLRLGVVYGVKTALFVSWLSWLG